MNAGFGRLDWVMLVVDRTRRTRQVVDLVNLEIEWKRHVVTQELKAWRSE
jgi:hypothetical protein